MHLGNGLGLVKEATPHPGADDATAGSTAGAALCRVPDKGTVADAHGAKQADDAAAIPAAAKAAVATAAARAAIAADGPVADERAVGDHGQGRIRAIEGGID